MLVANALVIVAWIISTHFSGASPSSIYANYSASKIVQPELHQTPVWLPVEQHTVFKTATLVYKFLHTGFPRYFASYISSYSRSYSTRRSQSGGNFLVIPNFYCSVHKSVKCLVIVLLFMLPLCGMLFQMRFMPLPP